MIVERQHYGNQLNSATGPNGRVVATDRDHDLALVQLESLPPGTLKVPLPESSARPGQRVHTVGNPGASDALWVYTSGTVRQVYRKNWVVEINGELHVYESQVVETQSPTNPGDSGGPLVDDRGALVGVTQGGRSDAQLVSLFIDVSEVKNLVGGHLRSVGARLETVPDSEGMTSPETKTADVLDLMKVLKTDRNADSRARAVLALRDIGPRARLAVRALVNALNDADDGVRKLAGEALDNVGPPAEGDASALKAALTEANPQVRTYAAIGLARLGVSAEEILPILVAAARDATAPSRQSAVAALGDLGPKANEALPVLLQCLQEPRGQIRLKAAEAVAKLGPEADKAVPHLVKLLNDADADARSCSCRALASIGPRARDAVSALVRLLDDHDKGIRIHAMRALGAIGPESKVATLPLVFALADNDLRASALDALTKIGKPAVPTMVLSLNDKNPATRLGVIQALGLIGPEAREAIIPLRRVAKSDRSRENRGAAWQSLKRIQQRD